MGLLVGLLVVAMVQVSFLFSIVVGDCGQMWGLWVDVDVNVEVSFCYDFYFFIFVSGNCGMGGGLLVGGWQCGAGGAVRKRETEEREEK